MENLKLKKHHKLIIAADGSAASGKSTGSKLIAKKFNLKFLSSGLLYRYASYKILKAKPKNKVFFLKKCFKKFNLEKLKRIKLHTPEISKYSSTIAKEKKIREILKIYQQKFAKKHKCLIIEGRDIGTKILPKADIKFFFKCKLDVAAKRRFKELKKTNSKIKFIDVKKAINIRDNLDKKRKNSPLIQVKNAVIVDTSKIAIKAMVDIMTLTILDKIKIKYGNRTRN